MANLIRRLPRNAYLIYFVITVVAYPIKNIHPFIEDFMNISGIVALLFFISYRTPIKEKEIKKETEVQNG